MDRYDYRGAIHVHSSYSDGYGDVDEIMKAANEAGLDYVILTDHDMLDPQKHEGWHKSTLLIVGAEITPPENHYLVMGEGKLEGIETLKKRAPAEYVAEVGKQNWLGFIAHPNYIGSKRFGTGSYRWTDWSVDGFTGMSVWHLIDDWLRRLDAGERSPADLYEGFPETLAGPDPEMLAKWDQLTQQRRVVAIGELDNHKMTRKYDDREYVVFPYETAFRTITNHLLLKKALSKDAPKAKAQVLEALREGSLYISMDWKDDPSDFQFMMDYDDETFSIGQEFEMDGVAEASVVLPDEAEINLIRNSEVIQTERNFELVCDIDSPGVYRVEVKRIGQPWILSNPIYVRPPKE